MNIYECINGILTFTGNILEIMIMLMLILFEVSSAGRSTVICCPRTGAGTGTSGRHSWHYRCWFHQLAFSGLRNMPPALNRDCQDKVSPAPDSECQGKRLNDFKTPTPNRKCQSQRIRFYATEFPVQSFSYQDSNRVFV